MGLFVIGPQKENVEEMTDCCAGGDGLSDGSSLQAGSDEHLFSLVDVHCPNGVGLVPAALSICSLSYSPFIIIIIFKTFLALPQLVSAYTWAFNNLPSQCSPLSVSIVDGTGGGPPFSLLVVPYGHTPLPMNIEPRRVQTLRFNTSTEANFTLNYPAGSQFVAMVSLICMTAIRRTYSLPAKIMQMGSTNGLATGGTSAV